MLWVLQLQSEKISHYFTTELSTINVIAEENELGVVICRLTIHFMKHFHHIEKLAMDVSNNYDISFGSKQIWVLYE